MLRTKFSQFRAISIIEGISYLILVFLAMPLKYLFEERSEERRVGKECRL